jgi:serpin B
MARGINMLALDLYKTLAKEHPNRNVFFSPLSISSAFAMAYAGARGDTEIQMARVLHFSLPQSEFHPAFSSLVKSILTSSRKEGCTLDMANALWGQRGYGFLPEFKALLDKYYGSAFHEVDFVKASEATRREINSWIEEKTEGKIKDLIAQGDINQLTRLVLTNAIYFKGMWASRFKKENTRTMLFYPSPQKTLQVPMMYQRGEFPYFESHDL